MHVCLSRSVCRPAAEQCLCIRRANRLGGRAAAGLVVLLNEPKDTPVVLEDV